MEKKIEFYYKNNKKNFSFFFMICPRLSMIYYDVTDFSKY